MSRVLKTKLIKALESYLGKKIQPEEVKDYSGPRRSFTCAARHIKRKLERKNGNRMCYCAGSNAVAEGMNLMGCAVSDSRAILAYQNGTYELAEVGGQVNKAYDAGISPKGKDIHIYPLRIRSNKPVKVPQGTVSKRANKYRVLTSRQKVMNRYFSERKAA